MNEDKKILEFLDELTKLKENAKMLTEDIGYRSYPIIFSDNDIYVNYKDWLQSKSHVLIVTGIPGSGKSTLARKLAEKFDVHYVELDILTFKLCKAGGEAKRTWEYVHEHDILLYNYLKEKKLEPDFLAKQVDDCLPPKPIQFEETMKYMDWLIKDQSERCVIDGSCAAMFFQDHPEWQTLPIIFKGTSVLKAIARRLKRNVTKHGIIEGISLWISKVLMSVYSQYSRYAREQNIGRRVVLPDQKYDWVEEATKVKHLLPLNENYIFSQDNITSNVDKWISGEEPILYIIGRSGSGKTTLSNQLGDEYGCPVIHLDEIHYQLTKTHPEMIHGNPDKHRIIFAQGYKKLGGQRGIIEGDLKHVFQSIQDKPIILMGTSATTSSMRMIKRTLGIYDQFKRWAEENNKPPIIGPIGKIGSVMTKMAMRNFKDESEYQQIRDIIQQKKSLNEDYKMQFIFYHGSPKEIEQLEPVAPNLGNKWEPPKWVTYMWREKRNAIIWALQKVMRVKGFLEQRLNWNGTVVWQDGPYIHCGIIKDDLKLVKTAFNGLPFYVYTLQINPKTLGVGHATGLDEYTSTDPKPKMIKREKYIITPSLIDEYIEVLKDEAEFKKYADIAMSNSRGDLAGLMYQDQDELFKKELRIIWKQRLGLIKPGDNKGLRVIIDEFNKEKIYHDKIFSKFKTIRELVSWIKNNVTPLSKKDDTAAFIWPDEIFKKKKGNCIDLAILIIQFCRSQMKAKTKLARVGFSYRIPGNKTISHQYHVVAMYSDPNDTNVWKVVNFSFNEESKQLKNPIFSIHKTIEMDVLKEFANYYIPILYKHLITEEHPTAILEKRYVEIAKGNKVDPFLIQYYRQSGLDKQKLISKLFEDT